MSELEYEELLSQLSIHKGRILNLARMALDNTQFDTFRKSFLNEFGRNGFELELEKAVLGKERDGMGRNIHAGKEVS